MTEIRKPQLSEAQKECANKLYTFMRLHPTYHTREDLCNVLGWDAKTKDRQIRELISALAKVKPIISTSDCRGYKLATTRADAEEVMHQRRNTLSERTKRLREYRRWTIFGIRHLLRRQKWQR